MSKQRQQIWDALEIERSWQTRKVLVVCADVGLVRARAKSVRSILPGEIADVVTETEPDSASRHGSILAAVVQCDSHWPDGADLVLRLAEGNQGALIVATMHMGSDELLERFLDEPSVEPVLESDLKSEVPVLLRRRIKKRLWFKNAEVRAQLGARIAYEFGWRVADEMGYHVPVPPVPTSDAEHRRNQIEAALLAACGNQAEAARILGWNKSTLYRRMQKYDVPVPTLAEASQRLRATRSLKDA